ncbi:acetyl-CoA C-acyltransferase [Flavobacteriaceae bacterium]|nr:acetyl-CoA C-acyltransferase [Flavobacteriaceae bacterium]
MKNVVIVAAKRTPIGSFMGDFSNLSAPELGSLAIKGACESININLDVIDEVYMGNVLQAGVGQAPARQAAIKAGLSNKVPCTTVNKVCSSGMKSIMLAAQSIALGDNEVVVAGGMESMSMSPHALHLRNGVKFGPSKSMIDILQHDGLIDPYENVAMGVFADKTAEKYNFSREDQDNFAIESYNRSLNAWENGEFDNEVIPVSVKQRRGEPILIDKDEEFTNINIKKIPKLRPAFSKDGSVTAANASTINDGAAALILMSEEKAKTLNLTPLVKILSYADSAQEPQWFTTAPAKALPKALKKANLDINDIDLFELNEAFSVVGLANIKLLELDPTKVNVNGGAVSLGHPIGCSGARIVVTLIHAMQKDSKYGAAAICNGGGGASSIIFEK